jgi:hypothetical protein
MAAPGARDYCQHRNDISGVTMELVRQLFSDWLGVLSLVTVGFVLVMAVTIGLFVRRHVLDETQRQV